MICFLILSAVASVSEIAENPTILRTELSPSIAGVAASAVADGWLTVRTTAYTHTEDDHIKWGRKSAAGTKLMFGATRSAAADWSRFPLGTVFQIEGDSSIYVVDDYGSALVGNATIDLYRPSRGSMNQWGVRHVRIQILEWGSFERSLAIMDDRTHNKAVREMVDQLKANRVRLTHKLGRLL